MIIYLVAYASDDDMQCIIDDGAHRTWDDAGDFAQSTLSDAYLSLDDAKKAAEDEWHECYEDDERPTIEWTHVTSADEHRTMGRFDATVEGDFYGSLAYRIIDTEKLK